jgi:hypothetical protein
MVLDAVARRVIEDKLKFIRTLCRTERDEQCHSVLASESTLALLWRGVTLRRAKTRPKTDDRGWELVPEDERKFLAQGKSPINPSGMELLCPDPAWHETMTQAHAVGELLRETMTQAYAVAEFLRDLFFIMRNSNCDSVVQVPKASISEVRLRRCADKLAVLEQTYRERAHGFSFRAGMLRAAGSLAKADANLPREANCVREAEVFAAKADNDMTCAAILRQTEQFLSERSQDEALSEEDGERQPQSRQRTDPRDKLIADQISIAVMKQFGRPLDDFVARRQRCWITRFRSRSSRRRGKFG